MGYLVVINNYNYGRYLTACLESVLAQTRPFDRIIIVDDGSSDDSREIIQDFTQQHATIDAVLKPNGGQMSCFNAVVDMINDDDWVFLLDADDLFAPDHLEQVMPHFDDRADFVFCDAATFTEGAQQPISSAAVSSLEVIEIPSSSYLTRRTDCFIGRPTSANVLRGRLLKTLLPYPDELDWRTSADRVLVVGASIIGAHKRYLKGLAFAYRVHGNNLFYGKRSRPEYFSRYRQKIERLHAYYCAQQRLSDEVSLGDVLIERYTLPKVTRKQLFIPNILRILFIRWFPLMKLLLPSSLLAPLRWLNRVLR